MAQAAVGTDPEIFFPVFVKHPYPVIDQWFHILFIKGFELYSIETNQALLGAYPEVTLLASDNRINGYLGETFFYFPGIPDILGYFFLWA